MTTILYPNHWKWEWMLYSCMSSTTASMSLHIETHRAYTMCIPATAEWASLWGFRIMMDHHDGPSYHLYTSDYMQGLPACRFQIQLHSLQIPTLQPACLWDQPNERPYRLSACRFRMQLYSLVCLKLTQWVLLQRADNHIMKMCVSRIMTNGMFIVMD